MPKLHVYNRQVRPTGPVQNPGQSSANIGKGLQNLGNALGQVASAVGDVERKSQEFEADKMIMEFQKQQYSKMESAKVSADPKTITGVKNLNEGEEDIPSFSQKISKGFDEDKDGFLGKAKSSYQQDYMTSRMDQVGLGLYKQSVSYESGVAQEYEADSLRKTMAQQSNSARANPNYVDDLWKTQERMIKNAPVNPKIKGDIMDRSKSDIYDSALDGRVTNLISGRDNTMASVDAMIAEVKDGKLPGGEHKWKKVASRPGYDSALTRLQNYKKTLGVQKKNEFVDTISEEIKFMYATGKDRGLYSPEVIKSYGFSKTKEHRLIENLEGAQNYAKVHELDKSAPAPDLVKELGVENYREQLLKNPTKTNEITATFQARNKAFAERERRYKEDAPRFIRELDEQSQLKYDALQQLIQAKAEFPDIDIEDIQDAQNEYIEALKAKTAEIYPDRSPQVVDATEANSIAMELKKSIDSPEGSRQAVHVLQFHQQKYGKNWPLAVRDLRNRKVLSDEHYVASNMINNPEKMYLAEDIVSVAAISPKELKNKVSETEYKSIKSKVKDKMEDFAATLGGMNKKSAFDLESAYLNTITKLAAYQDSNSADMLNLTVSDITNKVLLDDYEFNSKYRIPKEHAALDMDEKESYLFGELERSDIYTPQDVSGRMDDAAKEVFKKRMIDGATIVNYGDEGLKLIDPLGRTIFKDVDGKPVPMRWTWEDIKGMTNTADKKVSDQEYEGM